MTIMLFAMATNFIEIYEPSLAQALELLEMCPELEPKSALKQAGHDLGIPYGPEMGAFVDWAYAKIGDDPDHDEGDDERYSERI